MLPPTQMFSTAVSAKSAGTHRGRHLEIIQIVLGDNGVEPRPAFQKASPRQPERLQR